MVLLLPIGSKIVKENSDCSKDFATRRNEHKRHKSMAGSMIRPERSYRLINSEQVNPVRNSSGYGSKLSGVLNSGRIIQNTSFLQISGTLF